MRSDRCETISGTVIDPYHVVELPDWINVLALTPEREIVLVREYRHGTAEIALELPSGTVEPGEAPLAAAQRELREETGYGGGIWRRTAFVAVNPARQNNRVSTFLALDVTPVGAPRLEASEIIETIRLPWPALVAGLAEGSLQFHGQHLAALCSYVLPVLVPSDPRDDLYETLRQLWLARSETE